MFLAKSGLRISEALDLRVGDVDRKTGTVRVLHGKGDKARVCGVAESALVMLDRWLEVRAEIGAKRAAPLFCAISAGKVGNRLDTSSVRHMLRRRAARAGIEKRVHPHGLRHKLASDLVAKRVPLNSVQALLGHTHITTTARYVARINPTHAIEALRDALD
jgi:site-specific recombinase XerD